MNLQADLDACPDSAVAPSIGGIAASNFHGGFTGMSSTKVLDQLDTMIDDLLNESDLPASSLASILMAARDSVRNGYHVALARKVWDASNSIRDHYGCTTAACQAARRRARLKH